MAWVTTLLGRDTSSTSVSSTLQLTRELMAAPPNFNPFKNTPTNNQLPMPPVQINLCLRVERRREDGFHDLASLFQVVSWGDDMAFQPLGSSAGRDELVCNVADIPTDSRNLAIKVGDDVDGGCGVGAQRGFRDVKTCGHAKG